MARREDEGAGEVDRGPVASLTCLVATSERLRRVQRQFCTRRGLLLVRCLPKACIPPGARDGGTSATGSTAHQAWPAGQGPDPNPPGPVDHPHRPYLPASTIAGLLLGHTDSTLSTRLVVQSSFS